MQTTFDVNRLAKMMEAVNQRRVRNRLLELIQARERKIGRRLKQHDIAQFVGVSDHTIINWIRNVTTSYDGEIIAGLCDYFDCEIADLLTFEMIEDENSSEV